jgi:hypothetical protein
MGGTLENLGTKFFRKWGVRSFLEKGGTLDFWGVRLKIAGAPPGVREIFKILFGNEKTFL